jgi:hypothetical protein
MTSRGDGQQSVTFVVLIGKVGQYLWKNKNNTKKKTKLLEKFQF